MIPAPVTELPALRRLKLLRIASKQFAPLMLPPGLASLAPTLTEVILESADWPAIPHVRFGQSATHTHTHTHTHTYERLSLCGSSAQCQCSFMCIS